jgi:hypothetical protein
LVPAALLIPFGLGIQAVQTTPRIRRFVVEHELGYFLATAARLSFHGHCATSNGLVNERIVTKQTITDGNYISDLTGCFKNRHRRAGRLRGTEHQQAPELSSPTDLLGIVLIEQRLARPAELRPVGPQAALDPGIAPNRAKAKPHDIASACRALLSV